MPEKKLKGENKMASLAYELGFLIGKVFANSTNKTCPKCKHTYKPEDIVSEDLIGDGLSQHGRNRKLSVVVKCHNCNEKRKVKVYTNFRYDDDKGTAAQQYYKKINNKQ